MPTWTAQIQLLGVRMEFRPSTHQVRTMPKEDVMTSNLDEIQERAEAVEARKLTYGGIKVQLSQCEEDRARLLAALRAVEAVHANDGRGICTHCTDINGYQMQSWPCPTIRAIRGAFQ